MMRMEYVPPREMLRALVTAVGALRRAGVPHPREHVAVVASRDGLFTAVLVKRSPFREGEVERLAAWAGESPFFDLAAAPGRTAARANLYAAFLAKDDAARERAFVRSYPFDLRPVKDDRAVLLPLHALVPPPFRGGGRGGPLHRVEANR